MIGTFKEYVRRHFAAFWGIVTVVLTVPPALQLFAQQEINRVLVILLLLYAIASFWVFWGLWKDSKEKQQKPDFDFEVKKVFFRYRQLLNRDDGIVCTMDCEIDVEIYNRIPDIIWLDFEAEVMNTDLPTILIKGDDKRFRQRGHRVARETEDRIPIKVTPHEIIHDSLLIFSAEMTLSPDTDRFPRLGKATYIEMEVKAIQSQEKFLICQIGERRAVSDLIEKIEERFLEDIKNKNIRDETAVRRLKLMWKGKE